MVRYYDFNGTSQYFDPLPPAALKAYPRTFCFSVLELLLLVVDPLVYDFIGGAVLTSISPPRLMTSKHERACSEGQ